MTPSQSFSHPGSRGARVFRFSPESSSCSIVGRILFGLLLLCGTARASTIPVDLGPSNNRVFDQLVVPFDSGIMTLSGQTLSIDYTFAGNSFVHLYDTTSTTFSVQPMLQLQGTGTIFDVVGQAYTFNSMHQQNSPLWSFGGGSVTGDGMFNFGLGYIFPLLNPDGTPRNGSTALDFYGAHFEFTLPNASNFDILGAQFGLFANGTGKSDYFAIGPRVPDRASTLSLLALGLSFVWASRRWIGKRLPAKS